MANKFIPAVSFVAAVTGANASAQHVTVTPAPDGTNIVQLDSNEAKIGANVGKDGTVHFNINGTKVDGPIVIVPKDKTQPLNLDKPAIHGKLSAYDLAPSALRFEAEKIVIDGSHSLKNLKDISPIGFELVSAAFDSNGTPRNQTNAPATIKLILDAGIFKGKKPGDIKSFLDQSIARSISTPAAGSMSSLHRHTNTTLIIEFKGAKVPDLVIPQGTRDPSVIFTSGGQLPNPVGDWVDKNAESLAKARSSHAHDGRG